MQKSRQPPVQRTAAAGLRPPPLYGLIEGPALSVNVFHPAREVGIRQKMAAKVLNRLNFRPSCR